MCRTVGVPLFSRSRPGRVGLNRTGRLQKGGIEGMGTGTNTRTGTVMYMGRGARSAVCGLRRSAVCHLLAGVVGRCGVRSRLKVVPVYCTRYEPRYRIVSRWCLLVTKTTTEQEVLPVQYWYSSTRTRCSTLYRYLPQSKSNP